MSPADSQYFTFTWQIENFSMCPHKLSSPSFEVSTHIVSKWRLSLYPRGRKTWNFVSCFLECVSLRRYLEKIAVGFEIVLFSAISSKCLKFVVDEHVFSPHSGWGWDKLVSKDTLQNSPDDYLPNDTLTIVCKIWRLPSPNFGMSSQSGLATSPRLQQSSSGFGSNKILIKTTIKVHKKIFTWPISPCKKFEELYLTSPLENIPSFYLQFHPLCLEFYPLLSDRARGRISIRPDVSFFKQIYVRCEIFNKGNLLDNQSCRYLKFDHIFKYSERNHIYWHTTFFGDEVKDFFLQCVFKISQLDDISHWMDLDIVPTMHDDFLFRNVPHHFTRSTFRNRDGNITVETTDISQATVDQMLSLMNTNSLGNIKDTEVIDLYHAACWYEVLPMRRRCVEALKLLLSLENLCDILIVTDLHQDKDLKDAVIGFIRDNPQKVFESPKWKLLVKSKSVLAVTVMSEICSQKFGSD